MRVLLDTNILIHREARTVVREDIGDLFWWLDELGHTKCVHPDSVSEIKKHADEEVVRTLGIKLGNYKALKTRADDTESVAQLRLGDLTPNDSIDTNLIAELAAGRVSALISEDRGIHRKAHAIGLGAAVFTIDSFLEKVTAENPALLDYDVLAVRKMHFGELKLTDPFFDSFREDYPGFDAWFNRKADEEAYVAIDDDERVVAFLYLKREDESENYSDIEPSLPPARRLKIGTFKVVANGFKLGERFLKIVFDNALRARVEAIYLTLFRRTSDHDRLARLLGDWGFDTHGVKESGAGEEEVLVRDFTPRADGANPQRCFPYVSASARKFVVPIYPQYHTDLLPDSVLNTEDPAEFTKSETHRNALSKVYVSRSIERDLRPGDIIVFYRTKSGGSGHHTSVATTVGVVQEVIRNIPTGEKFVAACRKRSVFSDAELLKHWNYNARNRPFVVNFLYVYSFPKRPNLAKLLELGILTAAPRGFERLDDEAFSKLIQAAQADDYLIVDQA